MSAIIFPFVNFARYSSSVASSLLGNIHAPLTSTPAQRRAAAEEEQCPVKVPRRSSSTTSLNTEAVFASGAVLAREQPKEVAFDIVEQEEVVDESSALVKQGGSVETSPDMQQRGWYEPVPVQQQKDGKGKAPIRDWESGSVYIPVAPESTTTEAVATIPSDTDSIPSKRRRGFTGRLLRLPFTILLSIFNVFFRLTYGNIAIRAPDLEEGRQIAAHAYNAPVAPIVTNVGENVPSDQQPVHIEKRTELVPGSAVDEVSPVENTTAASDLTFPPVPTTVVTAPAASEPTPILLAADGSEVVSEKKQSKTEQQQQHLEVGSESPNVSSENMVKIGEIRSRTPSILDEPLDTAHNSPAVPSAAEVPLVVDGAANFEGVPQDQVGSEGYLATVEEEDEEDIASVGRGVSKKPVAAAPAEELKKVVEEEEKPVVADSPKATTPVVEQVPVVEAAPVAPAPVVEPVQAEVIAAEPEPVAEVPAPAVVEKKEEEVAIEVEPTPVPSLIAVDAPAVEVAPVAPTPAAEVPAKIEAAVEEVKAVLEKAEAAPVAEKTPDAEKAKRRMSWLPKKDDEAVVESEEKPPGIQRSWTTRRPSTAGVKSKIPWKPTKKESKPEPTPEPTTTTTTTTTTDALTPAPSASTETVTTVPTNPAPEPHFEKPNLMKRMSWTPSLKKDRAATAEKRSSWASSFKLDHDKKKEKKSSDSISIASTIEKKKTLGSMFSRSKTTGSIPTTATTTAANSAANLLSAPTSTTTSPALNGAEFPPTPPHSIQEKTSSIPTLQRARSSNLLRASRDNLKDAAAPAGGEELKKKDSTRKKWIGAGKAIGAFKMGKK